MPLHYASKNGHTDVVELLIDHGAQIDVPAEVQEWVSLSCDMLYVIHSCRRRAIVPLLFF